MTSIQPDSVVRYVLDEHASEQTHQGVKVTAEDPPGGAQHLCPALGCYPRLSWRQIQPRLLSKTGLRDLLLFCIHTHMHTGGHTSTHWAKGPGEPCGWMVRWRDLGGKDGGTVLFSPAQHLLAEARRLPVAQEVLFQTQQHLCSSSCLTAEPTFHDYTKQGQETGKVGSQISKEWQRGS